MTICFANLKDATRERVENVEYVGVEFSMCNGRPTRFYKVYTKDNKERSFKYKDYMVYWISEG